MTEQIIDAAVPTVVPKRFGGHMLRVECPFCRTRKGKGKPIIHVHGTGGEAGRGLPGPWHGHRLAHCNPDDLPPELREWRRNHSLGYYIVEATGPREIDAPSLAEQRGRTPDLPHKPCAASLQAALGDPTHRRLSLCGKELTEVTSAGSSAPLSVSRRLRRIEGELWRAKQPI